MHVAPSIKLVIRIFFAFVDNCSKTLPVPLNQSLTPRGRDVISLPSVRTSKSRVSRMSAPSLRLGGARRLLDIRRSWLSDRFAMSIGRSSSSPCAWRGHSRRQFHAHNLEPLRPDFLKSSFPSTRPRYFFFFLAMPLPDASLPAWPFQAGRGWRQANPPQNFLFTATTYPM